MVDVPQQKLHSVAICLRRTVKRCFPLLSGVVLLLPVSADGIPRGLKLEHDHPQTPRRKGQEQKRDEPCAAHQRQDRNDHTDQDGDTSPEGTGSFHKKLPPFKYIFLEKQKKRNRTDESFLNHLVRFLFRCAGFIPAVLPGHRRSVRQRREKPLFHSVLDGLFPAFAEQAPNRPI